MADANPNSADEGTSEQPSVYEKQVREWLDAWAKGQRWLPRRFGSRMTIEELTTESAFVIRCVSEYERRSVNTEHRPYSGGAIDGRGRPPDPWSLAVIAPTDFKTSQTRLVLPHSDHIETCGRCGGQGNVTCGTCHGKVEMVCGSCGGAGTQICFGCGGAGRKWETRYATVQVNLPNGGISSQGVTEMGPVTCLSCGGGGRVGCGGCGRTGWVRCTQCRNGQVQCGVCAGHGRVLRQQIVTVAFAPKERKEVLNPLSLPGSEVEAAEGVTVADAFGPQLRLPPPETPPVLLARVQAFLKDLAETRPANERLHFERLNVTRVDVTEIHYSLGKLGPFTLWLSGQEARVHAPDAPKDAGKLFLAGAVTTGITCIIAALLYSAWMSNVVPQSGENRALEIPNVPTHLPASPPASFKVWVQDVAYTMRVRQMPKGPEYFKNDVDWLTWVAADNDINAVSTWKISLDAPETETAKKKIRPFYHDLFSYMQTHSASLAASQSSPYMAPAWTKMRNSKALCYVYGINKALFHKPTSYQPWRSELWLGYLQRPQIGHHSTPKR